MSANTDGRMQEWLRREASACIAASDKCSTPLLHLHLRRWVRVGQTVRSGPEVAFLDFNRLEEEFHKAEQQWGEKKRGGGLFLTS